jgi:hypothetical protein
MYSNSKLINSCFSVGKTQNRINNNNKDKNKENNNNNNDPQNLNLKNIDYLSYRDIKNDPKMTSYIIGANLLGSSYNKLKNLNTSINQNLTEEGILFSQPNKTNSIRILSSRGQSNNNNSNNLNIFNKNFAEENLNLNLNTNYHKTSSITNTYNNNNNNYITDYKKKLSFNKINENDTIDFYNYNNNNNISPKKQQITDMENNFKNIFNKTKKGLNFKSELNDKSYINKANLLTESQGHLNKNNIPYNDNKNKEKKNNFNTIDSKREIVYEDLLSNKINKLKVSKNMKTKFNEINTMTEKMKSNLDTNELMDSIKQKSTGINRSINDLKSRSK